MSTAHRRNIGWSRWFAALGALLLVLPALTGLSPNPAHSAGGTGTFRVDVFAPTNATYGFGGCFWRGYVFTFQQDTTITGFVGGGQAAMGVAVFRVSLEAGGISGDVSRPTIRELIIPEVSIPAPGASVTSPFTREKVVGVVQEVPFATASLVGGGSPAASYLLPAKDGDDVPVPYLLAQRTVGNTCSDHARTDNIGRANLVGGTAALFASWFPETDGGLYRFGSNSASASTIASQERVSDSTLDSFRVLIGFQYATDTVAPGVVTTNVPLGGRLTSTGGAATGLFVEYSDDVDDPEDPTRFTGSFNNIQSIGTFAADTILPASAAGTLAGLAPETTYWYQAFATNGAFEARGTIRSFTTTADGGIPVVEEELPPAPRTAPTPSAPSAPSPVTEPDGGVPVVAPGGSSGSVGGVPVASTPSRPSGGTAEFRVGTVETRVDVAVAGAGSVDGSDGAPVIRAVRDRVATISGGGMRPGDIAEVWMPLPDGGSRQVALLPVAADGTFDGALPFTGELDGRGPLPIGDRTIQLFGRDADGQLTVINFGVRIEQPAPIAPEPDRGRGVVPTLAPGQSLATNAGLPTPVTVTPLPDVRSTRIEGDSWLMDVDVPDGEVRDDGGAPLIEIVNGTDSVVRGTGFMAGTRAYVWLMSDPTFLGEVTVGADGTFSGSVPIAGVAPGEHTLQLSGVGTDGFVRAANLGVILVGDGTLVPARINAGGGPVPLVPLSMLLVVALLGTIALTTEHGRIVAASGAAERQARLRASARHRLPAFDTLQRQLDERRRTMRSGG